MAVSMEGVCRNGKIELAEVPRDVPDETRVVVTFPARNLVGPIDLRALGIDEARAASLCTRWSTFAEDWADPEMDIYNDYDAAKANS